MAYEFVDKLGGVSNLSDLEEKIEERLRDFISVGTTAADIALQSVYPVGTRHTAEEVFEKRLGGESVSDSEMRTFKGYLTYFLFKLYAKYGIATELHIGAMRNNNTKMYNSLGADTGFDSIASDEGCIHNMSRLFDRLNDEDALPKTIVFNLNPKMNTEIMTLIGSFQSSEACGKIQYGPAWWFLDNKVGMEKHLDDLVSTGHIYRSDSSTRISQPVPRPTLTGSSRHNLLTATVEPRLIHPHHTPYLPAVMTQSVLSSSNSTTHVG